MLCYLEILNKFRTRNPENYVARPGACAYACMWECMYMCVHEWVFVCVWVLLEQRTHSFQKAQRDLYPETFKSRWGPFWEGRTERRDGQNHSQSLIKVCAHPISYPTCHVSCNYSLPYMCPPCMCPPCMCPPCIGKFHESRNHVWLIHHCAQYLTWIVDVQ